MFYNKSIDKRFLLFGATKHIAYVGWNSFRGDFDTIEEAKKYASDTSWT